MTDADLVRPDPTRTELVLAFLQNRFWELIAFGFFAVGIGFYLGFEPEIPREAKLFGLALVLLAPAGYMTGNHLVNLLWSPNWVYLLDLDATEVRAGLYRFPFEDFRNLEVIDGDLDQVSSNLYIGKNVDLEARTVQGTWRGTLSDRDLLRALSKIDECRGMLEADAKRGFAVESQAFTIVRSATYRAVRSVIRTFEKGTLPDEGQGIGEAVDSALKQFDLDRDLDLDDRPDPDPADVSDDPNPEADLPDPADLATQPEAPADD